VAEFTPETGEAKLGMEIGTGSDRSGREVESRVVKRTGAGKSPRLNINEPRILDARLFILTLSISASTAAE
jgi:hypothetical protein